MYAQYFGLKQEPFSIAPDPRYLFMSERHREALAHLLYGVKSGGGFVLLSGEIGAGKTTVCRCFLEKIPKRCNVAYIFNPKLTVDELLKTVCEEFRIPYQHQGPGVATVKDYLDPLNEFLLKTHAVGQNNVLIIDEAQNLSADVLEQLRLLTNLETAERKLLQIILIGQPELRTMLARPELEQLAQRVIARFHLEALSQRETAQYIRHRLDVAGMSTALPFSRGALQRIHQLSRGVPRRINLLCDRAMLGAYANSLAEIDEAVVDKAAGEVFDNNKVEPAAAATSARFSFARLAVIGSVCMVAGAALFAAVTLAMDSGSSVRKVAGAADRVSQKLATPAMASSSQQPALAAVVASGSGAASAVGGLLQTTADLKAGFKSLTRSEKEAWRELAASWKLALGEGDPCLAAARQQVHCYRSSSGLALIRQLERPGIVTLHDENDKPAYALLTGLTSQSATLRMGGVSQTVALSTLAKMWRGDFATFWRAPPGYAGNGVVVERNSGLAAQWLIAQLARLDGEAPADTQQALDDGAATLKSRVSSFQLAQGLKPDGLAGPTTLMQLNRATGVEEPRLLLTEAPKRY